MSFNHVILDVTKNSQILSLFATQFRNNLTTLYIMYGDIRKTTTIELTQKYTIMGLKRGNSER